MNDGKVKANIGTTYIDDNTCRGKHYADLVERGQIYDMREQVKSTRALQSESEASQTLALRTSGFMCTKDLTNSNMGSDAYIAQLGTYCLGISYGSLYSSPTSSKGVYCVGTSGMYEWSLLVEDECDSNSKKRSLYKCVMRKL